MPEWTKSQPRPTRIALLLFDRFSNLCLANCIEPLRAANTLRSETAFAWSILSVEGAGCRSSSGIEIVPDGALSGMGQVDYLFILASYEHDRHDTPLIRRKLRAAARQAETLVALDAGPWLLASAGLLDGQRATVHGDLLDAFTERFLSVDAARARIVRDDGIVTCAGAMSALDLTLDLISNHVGTATRLDVEALFLHGDPPLRRGPDEPPADPLVARALEVMRNHLERPLPVTALARHLSCQPRTLDRRFRARLGAPPGTVYRHLRLAEARKLIEDTRLGLAEIAVRCGYDSSAALSRAISRQYGASPRALRRNPAAMR
jgi:transcriptional regulator GlxA family with amidase domain